MDFIEILLSWVHGSLSGPLFLGPQQIWFSDRRLQGIIMAKLHGPLRPLLDPGALGLDSRLLKNKNLATKDWIQNVCAPSRAFSRIRSARSTLRLRTLSALPPRSLLSSISNGSRSVDSRIPRTSTPSSHRTLSLLVSLVLG